jgi:hypothetical protein
MVKETAEKLLKRPLEKDDGINIESINEIEFIIDTKLPKSLKDFYINIGNNKLFTRSFEYFLDIDKLYFKNNKLVFLEENQEVCIWGINTNEDDPIVFINADDEWYSLDIKLSQFIKIMMFYQCAQGYGNVENINLNNISEETKLKIFNGMVKEVDNDNLIIYWKDNILLWYYTNEQGEIVNDTIVISALTEEKLKEFNNKIII